jgi:glyoxylase-like metal-dependent hydrolase (beta-lactamase superfamily II)
VLEVKASPPADRLLRDGDVIEMGNIEFEVLHTPGHSRGGISLYSRGEGVVFTGDTLLKGLIGRTDLPFASNEEIMGSLERLLSLPNDTLVYPGHMETTDIGRERATNPFLPEL